MKKNVFNLIIFLIIIALLGIVMFKKWQNQIVVQNETYRCEFFPQTGPESIAVVDFFVEFNGEGTPIDVKASK